MANRPRLPNVDPEDLAKLASQYPGSRTSGEADASAGGTGSGGSGTGSAGTNAAAASPAGTPSSRLSASRGTGSGSSAAGGAAGSGSGGGSASRSGGTSATGTPPPAKARGSWSAAFLTFLFAVIALAAAVASIGAPSYRAEIRALLTTYVKPHLDLEQDTIDIVSGYDTDRLEVTYEGLDQRIEQLAAALDRVAATDGVSGDDVRQLLFRDETADRIDTMGDGLDALSGRVATIADEAAAQADRIDGLGADLAATGERLTAEMTGTADRLSAELATAIETVRTETTADFESLNADLQEAVARVEGSIASLQDALTAARGEIDALSPRIDGIDAAIENQVSVDAAIADRLNAVDERVDGLVGDFTDLLDLSDQVAQTVSTFKNENMPILAVIQLRDAINRSGPYGPELSFARRVLNGAPGIQAALEKLDSSASDGIASVPELRRDLRLIARNLGTIVAQVESWSDRVSGWFNMLVGASAVPEVRQGGSVVAVVATIDDALDRGNLELVIREGAALQAEWRSPALADWLQAVVERMEVTAAVGTLQDVVYTRATTSQPKGTDKAQ